jgi:hypothetical protein
MSARRASYVADLGATTVVNYAALLGLITPEEGVQHFDWILRPGSTE